MKKEIPHNLKITQQIRPEVIQPDFSQLTKKIIFEVTQHPIFGTIVKIFN